MLQGYKMYLTNPGATFRETSMVGSPPSTSPLGAIIEDMPCMKSALSNNSEACKSIS